MSRRGRGASVARLGGVPSEEHGDGTHHEEQAAEQQSRAVSLIFLAMDSRLVKGQHGTADEQ